MGIVRREGRMRAHTGSPRVILFTLEAKGEIFQTTIQILMTIQVFFLKHRVIVLYLFLIESEEQSHQNEINHISSDCLMNCRNCQRKSCKFPENWTLPGEIWHLLGDNCKRKYSLPWVNSNFSFLFTKSWSERNLWFLACNLSWGPSALQVCSFVSHLHVTLAWSFVTNSAQGGVSSQQHPWFAVLLVSKAPPSETM